MTEGVKRRERGVKQYTYLKFSQQPHLDWGQSQELHTQFWSLVCMCRLGSAVGWKQVFELSLLSPKVLISEKLKAVIKPMAMVADIAVLTGHVATELL